MLNWLLVSFFFHLALLLALSSSPRVNTSEAETLEVNIVSAPKFHQQAPIFPPLSKPLKSHEPGFGGEKHQEIDLTDYGNKIKSIVDPIWVSHIKPYQAHLKKNYEIIVLLLVNEHGNIYNIRVKKSSGDQRFDDLAVKTFREIGSLPIPPELVVKEGIEWTLNF